MVDEGGPVSGDALGWGVEGLKKRGRWAICNRGWARPSELAGDPRNSQAVCGDFLSPAPVGNGQRLGDFRLCAGYTASKRVSIRWRPPSVLPSARPSSVPSAHQRRASPRWRHFPESHSYPTRRIISAHGLTIKPHRPPQHQVPFSPPQPSTPGSPTPSLLIKSQLPSIAYLPPRCSPRINSGLLLSLFRTPHLVHTAIYIFCTHFHTP